MSDGPSMRGSLHQPPNPDDLRRVPPASPDCAGIRGLMRDFADGDLGAAETREVHEHVAVCRVCSVELARAEGEALQLRRAFDRVGTEERTRIPSLGADFASRVVDRLVLDDTASFPPRETNPVGFDAEAPGSAPVTDSRRSPSGARTGVTPSNDERVATSSHAPVVLVALAALLLVAFGAVALLFDGADRAPERSARLVLTRGKNVYGPMGRLFSGEGVGESQSLVTRLGGGAELDWHDLSSKSQPAATLSMKGNAGIRLQDGSPMLLNGKVRIDTHRPVTVAVEDGPTVQLGIGEYVIAADAFDGLNGDRYQPSMQDPLASAPGDLRVEIEVLRGEPAQILHTESGSTLIAQGSVGVYESGSGFVATRQGGTQVAAASPISRGIVAAPPAPTQATLAAYVTERSGVPSVGTVVGLAYAAQSAPRLGFGTTNANGAFVMSTEIQCESDFMILQAYPARSRSELGMRAPDAYRVIRQGPEVRCAADVVVDVSVPISGTVVDEGGIPKLGARILPCVVDELFGTVLPLTGLLGYSDEDGRFLITQLPVKLPPHQFLALVIVHPSERPAVVPVPDRGTSAALLPLPPIVLRPTRHLQLAQLPPHSTVEVVEEIESLPRGSATWQRSFTTDGFGVVAIANVGMGDLWLRSGGDNNPMVQKFTLDTDLPIGELPRFVPTSVQMPWSSVFDAQAPLSATNLQIASTYRHQHFLLSPPPNSASGRAMLVLDSLGRAVADAQVFAVSPSGPRGRCVGDFLGFTSHNGVASLEPVAGGGDIVVIARDGSTAFVEAPQQSAFTMEVHVATPGRVLLQPSLRPQGNASDRFVPIRFERLLIPLNGVDAPAYRFACEATGWEVGGLPPGTYRATVGEFVRFIVLQEGGFAHLQ